MNRRRSLGDFVWHWHVICDAVRVRYKVDINFAVIQHLLARMWRDAWQRGAEHERSRRSVVG